MNYWIRIKTDRGNVVAPSTLPPPAWSGFDTLHSSNSFGLMTVQTGLWTVLIHERISDDSRLGRVSVAVATNRLIDLQDLHSANPVVNPLSELLCLAELALVCTRDMTLRNTLFPQLVLDAACGSLHSLDDPRIAAAHHLFLDEDDGLSDEVSIVPTTDVIQQLAPLWYCSAGVVPISPWIPSRESSLFLVGLRSSQRLLRSAVTLTNLVACEIFGTTNVHQITAGLVFGNEFIMIYSDQGIVTFTEGFWPQTSHWERISLCVLCHVALNQQTVLEVPFRVGGVLRHFVVTPVGSCCAMIFAFRSKSRDSLTTLELVSQDFHCKWASLWNRVSQGRSNAVSLCSLTKDKWHLRGEVSGSSDDDEASDSCCTLSGKRNIHDRHDQSGHVGAIETLSRYACKVHNALRQLPASAARLGRTNACEIVAVNLKCSTPSRTISTMKELLQQFSEEVASRWGTAFVTAPPICFAFPLCSKGGTVERVECTNDSTTLCFTEHCSCSTIECEYYSMRLSLASENEIAHPSLRRPSSSVARSGNHEMSLSCDVWNMIGFA